MGHSLWRVQHKYSLIILHVLKDQTPTSKKPRMQLSVLVMTPYLSLKESASQILIERRDSLNDGIRHPSGKVKASRVPFRGFLCPVWSLQVVGRVVECVIVMDRLRPEYL